MLFDSLASWFSRPSHPTSSQRKLGFESLENRELLATTQMVKDINMPSGSYPQFFTKAGTVTFFIANTNGTGQELWKTDGSASGTVLVKDIQPGVESSYPRNLRAVGSTLYFTATTPGTGRELWKSDGTAGGTVLVSDIVPGVVGSSPAELFPYKGKIYFTANTSTQGRELWSSSGTAGTTALFKDIRVGSASGMANGSAFTNVSGTLFFLANNGTQGRELWKTNGTSSGTFLVKDINTGSASAGLKFLTNVSGTLYFTATNGTQGYELWKSNGTSAGTVLVKDINAGSGSSIERYAPKNFTNVNGTLYFVATNGTAGNELWKSNGSATGTVLVKDIRTGSLGSFYPGNAGNDSDATRTLTNVSGILYFYANNGVVGNELWRSDGTATGTLLVKDVNPGSYGSLPNDGASLTNLNGTLYFVAFSPLNGTELWKSNGTSAGTVLVKDIAQTSLGSYPSSLANINGVLYFSADDQLNGSEFWIHTP
jgi:trimeric autotransporter adhesin